MSMVIFAVAMLIFSIFSFSADATVLRMGDVISDGNLLASDARKILLYSAELEQPENILLFTVSDVDFDGIITAMDARKVLRISAEMEQDIETQLNKTLESDEPSFYHSKFVPEFGITSSFLELAVQTAGKTEVDKWCDNFEHFDAGGTRSAEEFNLFWLIKELNLPREEVEKIIASFIKMDGVDSWWSADAVDALYSDENTAIAFFANPYAVVISKAVYTPQWLLLHTEEEYKKVGITTDLFFGKEKILKDEFGKAFITILTCKLFVLEIENKKEYENEAKELVLKYEYLKNTTKSLSLQGKTLNAVYSTAEKTRDIKKHDTLFYMTANGDRLGYDALTGQLVYLSIKGLYGDSKRPEELRVSEKEATAIAEEFAKANCDMSKYTFLGCTYYDNAGHYMVEYGLKIQGYETSESMGIALTNTGEIRFFSFSPYIFDDKEIKPVDEQVLKKKLDELVKAVNADSLVSYEIEGQWLAIDKNNRLIMKYETVINFKVSDSNGKTEVFTNGVIFEIKL